MRDRPPRLLFSILSLLICSDAPAITPCKVKTSGRPGRGHRDGPWQTLFAILIATGLLVVLHETGKFFRIEFAGYLWIWLPVLLLLFVVLKQRPAAFPLHPIPRPLRPAMVLLLFMVLALFTGWPDHRWFYFLRWNQPTWPHLWAPSTIAMVFFVLTALLTPLFLRPRKWLPAVLWICLGLFMVHCLVTLYQHTGWTLMIRDDHPSFAFRIWKVSEVFPRLESYVPFWNGGEIHAYALTSGAIGPALLMYPFIKWFSIEQIYTPAVGVLFILVMPLLAVWAARIAGLRRTSQVAAGFLALCTTQFYFLWLAQFGTIGANFAAAFVMPFAACLYRALFFQDHSIKLGVYTVISGICLLMWPPGAAMAGLVTLGVLVNVKQWNWPTWRFLLICAGCVVLIHARQYLVIAGSDIWGLITEDSPDPERTKGLFVLQLSWLLDAKGWLRAHYDENEAGIISRCYLLNDYDEWEPAQNPFNRYSSIERDDVPNKLGIGYTFVKTLLERDPDVHIGIIVNARGGASMKYWEKDEWAYREAVRRTRIAQPSGKLRGILWHHGEANRGDNRYLRRLVTFVHDLRAEFDIPDLPFVAGQIKDPGVVNRQIARLPNRVPHTAYAPIDGLTTFDRSHFDTRSIKIMGRLYAELMIELQEAHAAHTSD